MDEIVGYDTSIDSSAIAKLIAATHHLFPQLETCSVSQAWAGLRPATPTGLPVVGKRKDAPDNLIFNTGHGGLGLTLAFGSAVQVASLIQ
jgi:D-amino-acid dehydrogenase